MKPLSVLQRTALIVPLLMVSSVALRMAAFWRGIGRSRALAAASRPYERRQAASAHAILVLGDSTGVGVGAERPEDAIAGRLAIDFPDSDIVNVSRCGARVADALAQARQCAADGRLFDVAVLHLGGNDVVHGTDVAELAAGCDVLMIELKTVARHTVWLGPPNLGLAPLFPLPYAWLMSSRSRAATSVFAASATEHGVSYIDFSAPEHAERLRRRRKQHFAQDGFHPSSASYGYGYATARAALLAPTLP
ncbi:MAG: GDSL-type esterase/lipase family protein [Caldimonas sp.]